MLRRLFALPALLLSFALASAPLAAVAAPPAAMTDAEIQDASLTAYLYLYPLISMEISRRVFTNVIPGVPNPLAGPANSFVHVRAYPTADMRQVVRPNFDTLYSFTWLDLTKGPVIVSAPDTHGRYYLLPMLDMWTDVFASPGKRATGTAAATYAVVPPGWSGAVPAHATKIQAPTSHVWIIGRTQTNGTADYDAVHAIQNGYKATPLSPAGGALLVGKGVHEENVDMKTPPKVQVDTMKPADFFTLGLRLMATTAAPHVTDQPIVAQMARMGLVPSAKFSFASLDPTIQASLMRAVSDGQTLMQQTIPTIAPIRNGWQMNVTTMGVYGTYYLKRAIIAQQGLGANLPEDAVYPLLLADAGGQPLTGDNNYVIHFERSALPPARAFWSITMYDAQGFQVANPLNRFAIGDRDRLVYNPDGSLDLYFQHADPGGTKTANWLPSPSSGGLGITMRLYWPAPDALNGRWNPPTVTKVTAP